MLSGNRNFEARIHPNLKANFLASPPLVVAYAIAGTVLSDLMTEPVGKGKGGKDVYLGDIWPTSDEIAALMKYAMNGKAFKANYDKVATEPGPLWEKIKGVQRPGLQLAGLDLHRRAAVLRRLRDEAARMPTIGVTGARAIGAVRRLDHHRPHLAGRRDQGGSPAGQLAEGRTASSRPTSTPTARAAATTT